jgi:hypothetical protein
VPARPYPENATPIDILLSPISAATRIGRSPEPVAERGDGGGRRTDDERLLSGKPEPLQILIPVLVEE